MVNQNLQFSLVRAFIGVLLSPLFGTLFAAAQVHTEVSPRVGALDETFVFSVVVDSPSDSAAPVLSPSEDFGVSYIGPQSSVSIINGDVRKRVAYNYRLIPRRLGTLKTPAVDVEVGGNTQHAEPLEVKITNEPPAVKPQKVSGVALKQSVDPKSAYVGQQIDSTLELQTAINLVEPQFVDLSFDGFWVESIADNERSSRTMGGDQYDILRFRKALYPLSPGTLIIPPRKLKAQVRDMRRNRSFPFDSFNPFDADMLDDFFGGGVLKPLSVESNGISVEVKELPPAPANFPSSGLLTPLVGETTVSVRVPAGEMKVGDTKTIEIMVTSTGNLNPLKSLALKVPASLKTYEDAPESKNFESGGALMSRKIFRVSLVPLRGGEIRIPPVELGYFDTTQDSYQIAKSQEIVLAVEPDRSESVGNAQQGLPTIAVATPGPGQIATPPSVAELPVYQEESAFERLNKRVSTSMLLLVLAALCALAIIARTLRSIRIGAAPARRGLAEIRRASDLSELSLALRSYASLKLGIENNDLRGEQFRVLVERKISNKDLRFALQAVLDAFDAALYAPNSEVDFAALKERALSVARSL